MFYQIFLSPQVKQCEIITYEHCIYELIHNLRNSLRLKKSGNIRKVSQPHTVQSSRQRTLAERLHSMELRILLILAKKILKNRN